jgi:hypothetical protein
MRAAYLLYAKRVVQANARAVALPWWQLPIVENALRQCYGSRACLHTSVFAPSRRSRSPSTACYLTTSAQAASTAASTAAPTADAEDLQHCADTGLRLVRALAHSDAPPAGAALLEALHWLLRAGNAQRADVWFALGNLHYFYSDELETAERAALGGEGAAKAVIDEIKALRRQVLKERRRKYGDARTRPQSASSTAATAGGVVVTRTQHASTTSLSEVPEPTVSNQEALHWYTAAAEAGHTSVSACAACPSITCLRTHRHSMQYEPPLLSRAVSSRYIRSVHSISAGMLP